MQLRAIIATRLERGLNMSMNLSSTASKVARERQKDCVWDSGTQGQRDKSWKSNDHNKLRVPSVSHSSIGSESFGNTRK